MFGFEVTPQVIPAGIYDPVLISSYSLSVAATLLSTMIIVVRILLVARMPGASRQPWIIMEIIVESAALYSISALVYTPMLADLSLTASLQTYYLYADIFFAYMAVEFHPSSFSILIS
jgi:hypothetical protein